MFASCCDRKYFIKCISEVVNYPSKWAHAINESSNMARGPGEKKILQMTEVS